MVFVGSDKRRAAKQVAETVRSTAGKNE